MFMFMPVPLRQQANIKSEITFFLITWWHSLLVIRWWPKIVLSFSLFYLLTIYLSLFSRGASWSSGFISLPTAPRVGGSNSGLSPFSFMGTPRHASIARQIFWIFWETRWQRTVKTRERREGRRTGRHFRNGYEKRIWFVSKTIKWLTPNKEWHGEKNYNVLLLIIGST